MVNWIQAWWQLRESWTFLSHAYRCGWCLYADVAGAWSHRGYAMAYAVAQLTPRASLVPVRIYTGYS
jgi:hypothetical protein